MAQRASSAMAIIERPDLSEKLVAWGVKQVAVRALTLGEKITIAEFGPYVNLDEEIWNLYKASWEQVYCRLIFCLEDYHFRGPLGFIFWNFLDHVGYTWHIQNDSKGKLLP